MACVSTDGGCVQAGPAQNARINVLLSQVPWRGPAASLLLKGLVFAALQVCLSTSAANYTVSKPTGTYKKVYCHLTEQADIAVEVCMDPSLVTGALVSTS